jgi:hypothetical protein
MTSAITFVEINNAFRKRGLSLQKPALVAVANVLKDVRDPHGQLGPLVAHIKSLKPASPVIPLALMEQCIGALTRDRDDVAAESLSLVTPYDTGDADSSNSSNTSDGDSGYYNLGGNASLEFDTTNKAYRLTTTGRQLHPDMATARPSMYAARLALAHARILTHPSFHHTPFSPAKCELTAVGSLLGTQVGGGRKLYVLGIIVSNVEAASSVEAGGGLNEQFVDAEGASVSYAIHDTTGTIPLVIPDGVYTDSIVPLHSAILIEASLEAAPGFYSCPTVLRVSNVSLPMFVPRAQLIKTLPDHVTTVLRLNGNASAQMVDEDLPQDQMIIIVKSLDLNNPSTTTTFMELLAGFESVVPQCAAKPLFVLMGPLCNPSSGMAAYRSAFRTLAACINGHPNIARESKFLIIPSTADGDVCTTMLPQMAFPNYLMKEFGELNVTSGTNPCRVDYRGKEIVFFNSEELMSSLYSNSTTNVVSDLTPIQKMFKTILDSAHLDVGAVVRPDYDHGMTLHVAPDILVLGSRNVGNEGGVSNAGTQFTYGETDEDDGAVCIASGWWGTRGEFVVMYPEESRCEFSEIEGS